MTAPEGGELQLPHTWRPRRARLVGLTMAVVVAVGGVLLAIALPSGPRGHYAAGDRVGIAAVCLLAALGLLVLVRPRLDADAEGLTVVNFVHRRRLSWAEVLGVDLAPTQSWASLDLADGTALPVVALQTADGARFHRQLADLRSLVETRGAADPSR